MLGCRFVLMGDFLRLLQIILVVKNNEAIFAALAVWQLIILQSNVCFVINYASFFVIKDGTYTTVILIIIIGGTK